MGQSTSIKFYKTKQKRYTVYQAYYDSSTLTYEMSNRDSSFLKFLVLVYAVQPVLKERVKEYQIMLLSSKCNTLFVRF